MRGEFPKVAVVLATGPDENTKEALCGSVLSERRSELGLFYGCAVVQSVAGILEPKYKCESGCTATKIQITKCTSKRCGTRKA